MTHPELSVVMPVYNEAAVIGAVLAEWLGALDRLGTDYVVWVCDDGSDDDTPEILARLAARHAQVQVAHHPNRGHGPTVLRGYREARGEWILQVDGDGEIGAAALEPAWRLRGSYHFVIGRRARWRRPLSRRIVSACTRRAVRILYGGSVGDPNAPFRLMQRERLERLLPFVPADTFAPNLALTGLAVASGLRVGELLVRPRERTAAPSSLSGLPLLRAAARALNEAARIRARYRAAVRSS